MATTFPKFDLRLLVHRRRLNMPLTPLLTLLDAESPCLRLEDDDARHLLLALSFERITRIVHDRVECCRPADLSQLPDNSTLFSLGRTVCLIHVIVQVYRLHIYWYAANNRQHEMEYSA